VSIRRAGGFGFIAIGTAMVGMAWDIPLAIKSEAVWERFESRSFPCDLVLESPPCFPRSAVDHPTRGATSLSIRGPTVSLDTSRS
jgi:hypothetical protein